MPDRVRLTFCLRRQPALSAEEFHRYWLDEHAPRVLRHADTLGMIRYVQGHCRPGGLNEGLAAQRGTAEPFDGIADAWFADLPSMLAAAGSEAGVVALKELMADELRFIDVTRSCVFVVDEFELLGSGGCRAE